MKKIHISGGSHCIGGGFNWKNIIDIYKQIGYDINHQYDVTYSKILGNHYNCEVIYNGDYGGSVNKMVRVTYEYIFKNGGNDTLFIFEVPPGWRDEFYSNELKRNINMTIGNIMSPHDETDFACGYDKNDMVSIHKNISDYFYNFVNYEIDLYKWMYNFYGLISFLKLNNYNHIIIDSGDLQKFMRKYGIDEHDYNLLWFDNGNAMNNWMNEKGLTIKVETNNMSNDEHLGIEGHKLVAKKIISFINENKTYFS